MSEKDVLDFLTLVRVLLEEYAEMEWEDQKRVRDALRGRVLAPARPTVPEKADPPLPPSDVDPMANWGHP